MTLQPLELKATLLEPVAIRANRQSTRSEGLAWIPGSTLLGALAHAYLRWAGAPDDDGFQILFQDENHCRWGSLRTGIYQPPATAASCKRFPGISGATTSKSGATPPADSEAHGIHDLLLAELLALRKPEDAPTAILCRCGEPLKPYRSPLLTTSSKKGGLQFAAPAQPVRRTRLHVGILRTTSTAAKQILFSEETLDCWIKTGAEPGIDAYEPTILSGTIELSDHARKTLKSLLDLLDSRVDVGASRSRGLGSLELKMGQPLPTPSTTQLDRFSNQAAHHLSGTDSIFTLTFPEGALFLDPLLRFTNDPAAAIPWLPPMPREDQKPETVDGITPLYGNAEFTRLRGWHGAHGLPRSDDLALEPGAIFAYEVHQDQWPNVQERLLQLAATGAGLRRNEGLGRVRISDPFHLKFAYQPTAQTPGSHPPNAPTNHLKTKRSTKNTRKKKKKKRKR